MASFDIDFPDDFMSELLETDFDEIAEEALRETAPLLEKSMRTACRRAVEHEGDSELAESITASKPKKTKTDAWIVNVGPKGYSKTKRYNHKVTGRAYPVSNALKAIWKEYGIAGQQAPRPFLSSAVNAVQGTVLKRVQEIYNGKVGSKVNVNGLLIEAGEAVGYPVEQDIYEGPSERSITFTYEDERDALAADNEGQGETAWIMVSMNTPQDYNYFADKKKLKKELKARGFNVESVQSWLEDAKTGTRRTRRTVFSVNITVTDEE